MLLLNFHSKLYYNYVGANYRDNVLHTKIDLIATKTKVYFTIALLRICILIKRLFNSSYSIVIRLRIAYFLSKVYSLISILFPLVYGLQKIASSSTPLHLMGFFVLKLL